jgi:Tol biopolymer transport system component
MKFPAKFNPLFDRFLLGGLGCGVIALCFVISALFYIWQNPPQPGPASTVPAFGGLTTVTPGPTSTPLFQFATPSVLPTGFPIASPTPVVLEATSVSGIPSPVPQSYSSALEGKIVFTCFVNQIDQICLMNADGSARRQLTDFEATSFYPSLSPDGDTIYFSSRQTGNFEIYSMNLRGRGLRRLTGNLGSLYAPERGEERIVFTNNSDGAQRIWIMRSDGNNPHAISSGPEDIDPTYSPDGMFIAFASARSGQRQLYVMGRDGSNLRQLTSLPDMGGRSTWSPDGRRLAFYAGPPEDHNIFVINADGTGLVQLTNEGDNLGPSWSPDGQWIAFTSFRDGNNEIYVMHPDGTSVTRLTTSPTSDWQPRWGP